MFLNEGADIPEAVIVTMSIFVSERIIFFIQGSCQIVDEHEFFILIMAANFNE